MEPTLLGTKCWRKVRKSDSLQRHDSLRARGLDGRPREAPGRMARTQSNAIAASAPCAMNRRGLARHTAGFRVLTVRANTSTTGFRKSAHRRAFRRQSPANFTLCLPSTLQTAPGPRRARARRSRLFAVTGIVWCVWQHRAQRNAIELADGKLEFTPGWAVGWWFVPFANLVKPFQTVRELWKASHGGDNGRVVATWSVIGWWWGIWLGASVLGRFIARAGLLKSPSDVIRHDTWEIVANGVTIVAAILAIMIVRSVVALQERAVAPPVLGPLPPMPIAGVLVPEMPPPPPAG